MRKMASMGLAALAVVAVGVAMLTWGGDSAVLGLLALILAIWALTGAAIAHHPLLGAGTAGTLGALISAYLTRQHHSPAGSVCNVDEVFNCDLVNTSEHSEIAGVPIALLGLGFYAALAVIGTLGWLERPKFLQAHKAVIWGGAAATLYALFLAWASIQLGAWCLFCISTYGLSVLLLVAGVLASKQSATAEGPDRSLSAGALTFLAVTGVGALTCGSQSSVEVPGEPGAEDYGALFSKPQGSVVLRGNEPVWGDPNATYTIVEWADYECPHCGLVSPQLKELVQLHPDVKVIFKNYPLSSECNSNVSRAMHENACEAAAAGICAQAQGRFWEMSRQMFANQAYLSPDDLNFMAKELGLDVDAFATCMAAPETAARIQDEIEDGKTVGLMGTPALYVKGLHPTDEWIAMEAAAEGAYLLLQAVKEDGVVLPAAGPPPSP
jgi:uncharacterized membrane protein/predicted DsbA family dithiol-disulfide isomerase